MNDQKKVLLIDDEAELLDGISFILRGSGIETVLALSGEEGLKALVQNPDSLAIVCDINMPGMKGLEVLRRVREMNKDLPFILFTGFGSREKMLEAAGLGAFDFIEKPNIPALVEAVKSAIVYAQEDSSETMEDLRRLSEYKELLSKKKGD